MIKNKEEKKKGKDTSLEIGNVGSIAFEDSYSEKEIERYEDLRTLFSQDYEAWKEAQERGLDVKSSFRMMRLGYEGENPHYHVFTTAGTEELVKEELNTVKKSRFVVDNKGVERFKIEEGDKELFVRNREEWKMKESEIRERIREEIEREEKLEEG